MTRSLTLIALLISLVWCCSLSSQNATTSLRGTITDPQGAVIVGATVELIRAETGFHAAHISAKDGDTNSSRFLPGPIR